MKRVLVTGASGFIGRHCLPLLVERGFEVHAVVRSSGLPIPAVRWHFRDLLEPGAAAELVEAVRPNQLLHLGWCTQPGVFWNSDQNHEWLNATARMVQAFAEWGGERIVGTGSCAEYDWPEGLCHEFTTPTIPSTRYGQAKLAASTFLDAVSGQTNIEAAWARVFFLYGTYSSVDRMPGAVISGLLRGEPVDCTDGLQRRDFLHILDAAEAIVSLLDSEVTGPVNICSGEPVRIRDLAEKSAELLGCPELLRLGTLASRSSEPDLICGDSSRLRNELSWRPQYSIESGLQQTIDWWQAGMTRRAA